MIRPWRDDPVAAVLTQMRPDLRRLGLAVLAGTGAIAAAVALMGTSGWLISRAAQQPPVLYLMVAVVTVRALGIGRGVLRYLERLVSHDVALRGVVTARESLYRALSQAEPGEVAALRRGDLLTRLGADVDAVADVITRAVLPFAVAATSAVAAVAVLGVILPSAGAVLLAGLLVSGVAAPMLAARSARRAEQDGARTRAVAAAETHALLDGFTELTVAGAAPSRQTRLHELDRREGLAVHDASRPAADAALLSSLAGGLSVLGCLLLGATAVEDGRLAPVMLAVVILLPLASAEITALLPAAAVAWVRAGIAAARLQPLLALEPAVPVACAEASADAAITARMLSCGWRDRSPVLRDVDLDLPSGSRIAIVGASGAGKTTLLMTLAGLLPPAGGTLSCAMPLRRAVLHTADDAHVFTTTVRENLRLAQPGADDDALLAAMAAAGLQHWLNGLPDGLDMMLNESDGPSGRRLSGGERRRLLMARAVLSPAPVVLLDEPSEHLDARIADDLIRAALMDGPAGLFPGRTVVVATHRLSALDEADEVLVIDDGRIRDRGTHEALLARDHAYCNAWLAEQPSDCASQLMMSHAKPGAA